MSIEPGQLIAYLRERCEQDFGFFVRYFFRHRKGTKFQMAEHHGQIIEALMRVHRGEIRNLIINVPPRYSKTELVVVMFTAWCMARNPRCEFIHLSYSDPLVMENSDAIKEVIKSAEFQQLWPHVRIKDNKDSKKAWGTEQGGAFLATAAGGSVTGFGAGRLDDNGQFCGCLLIDDPLKPDDARSDPLREAVNRRWDETIKSRRNSPRTPTIVIMQRIHLHDFAGMLQASAEEHWEVLSLPALVDEGETTERALWPEKHTVEALHAMKAANAYAFASQYQQRPSPLGGGIIKGAWFGRYTVLPPIKWRTIYGDTAQKTGERNDYSVFECWGLGDDGRAYLLDMIRGKWEAPELKRRAVDFWAKHQAVTGMGALRRLAIEDKASGTGLIQDIRRDAKIPVKAIPRVKDKLTRVTDVVGYIEGGMVMLPDAAPFTSEFVAECEAFTADDTHAYDDQIDPMCDAIVEMLATKAKGMFG